MDITEQRKRLGSARLRLKNIFDMLGFTEDFEIDVLIPEYQVAYGPNDGATFIEPCLYYDKDHIRLGYVMTNGDFVEASAYRGWGTDEDD